VGLLDLLVPDRQRPAVRDRLSAEPAPPPRSRGHPGHCAARPDGHPAPGNSRHAPSTNSWNAVAGGRTADRRPRTRPCPERPRHGAQRNPPRRSGRLRERLERNLSGLIGPLLSRMIVDNRLRVAPHARMALADSLRFVEAAAGALPYPARRALPPSSTRCVATTARCCRNCRWGVFADARQGDPDLEHGHVPHLRHFLRRRRRATLDQLDAPWEGVLQAFVDGRRQPPLQAAVRGHGPEPLDQPAQIRHRGLEQRIHPPPRRPTVRSCWSRT
jgi:hypothetical protein